MAHQDYDKEIEDLGEAFGEAGSLMLRVILSYLRGQSADYTALAVIQRVRTYNPQTGKHSVELHLKHLERYPLKTPYTQIADHVSVTDLLTERRLNFIGVTITGLGQKVLRHGSKKYSVPKQELVSALEVPFHKETLKVAEGLKLWDVLRKELLTFRRKQNTMSVHISYEHWRESGYPLRTSYPDIALAVAVMLRSHIPDPPPACSFISKGTIG